MKAKLASNIIKLTIVAFIFLEYHLASTSSPMSADQCKGLLFIALAGFMILLPIDASIFIKNFYSNKNINKVLSNNDQHKSD